MFDGLRSALETMRSEFELEPREDRPHQLPWLLAHEDEDLALFLVRRTGKTERYSAMYVEREGDVWGFGGYTDDCRPRPLITHRLGSSEWRVDPESPPAPESSTFPIEVMEHECATGRRSDRGPDRRVRRGRHHHHRPGAPGRGRCHVSRQSLDAVRARAGRAHRRTTTPRWWPLAPSAAPAVTVARALIALPLRSAHWARVDGVAGMHSHRVPLHGLTELAVRSFQPSPSDRDSAISLGTEPGQGVSTHGGHSLILGVRCRLAQARPTETAGGRQTLSMVAAKRLLLSHAASAAVDGSQPERQATRGSLRL